MVVGSPLETLNEWLRGRIAALRGARSLAYLFDMSRSLRSVRLALHPARCFLQRFPLLIDARLDWLGSRSSHHVLTLTGECALGLSQWLGLDGRVISFDCCVRGHAPGGSLYPPRVELPRAGRARYRMDGHGHRFELRGLLDGLPGWHYALQRGIAEAVLALKLIEATLAQTGSPHKES